MHMTPLPTVTPPELASYRRVHVSLSALGRLRGASAHSRTEGGYARPLTPRSALVPMCGRVSGLRTYAVAFDRYPLRPRCCGDTWTSSRRKRKPPFDRGSQAHSCLLYTSDAADE